MRYSTATFIHQVADYGFNGAILESMNTYQGTLFGTTVMKYNVEAVGNLILTFLRYFNQ